MGKGTTLRDPVMDTSTNTSELMRYLELGGPTLWLIIFGSILALTVAIERALALWGVSAQSAALTDSAVRSLLRGEPSAARSAAERSRSPLGDVFLAGLDRAGPLEGRPSAKALERAASAISRARSRATLALRARLWILGSIGATAPFVGLFGTVAGIMRSFEDLGADVAAGGTGGSAAVMLGISEALIVTAAGILVAVEAVLFFNYFQSRLSRLSVELRLHCEELLEALSEMGGRADTGPGEDAPTPGMGA